MKKLTLLLLLTISSVGFAQTTYENGWGVGLVLTSPRMFADTYNENFDFGGGLTLVRDLDEMNTIRLKVNYNRFTSVAGPTLLTNPPSTDAFGIGLDYLMTLNPYSKTLKVYGGVGFSIIGYKVENPFNSGASQFRFGELSMNVSLGARHDFSKDIAATVEIGHHTLSTDKFDGIMGPNGGIFGGVLDSYASVNLGLTWYFSRGPESKPAALPSGVEIDYKKIEKMINDAKVTPPPPTPPVDYNKIEDMIKKYLKDAPKHEDKKPDEKKPDVIDHEITLHAVYFDLNSSEIKAEYQSILDKNAGQLLQNKAVKVEVIGHTDISGDPAKNQALSEKRAMNVKNYLVKKGVEASRMTTKAVAATMPAASNDDDEGKALNRRVDFKVVK